MSLEITGDHFKHGFWIKCSGIRKKIHAENLDEVGMAAAHYIGFDWAVEHALAKAEGRCPICRGLNTI